MTKEKVKDSGYKIESVHNPFTKETVKIRLKETGKDDKGNLVAQGWFPLDTNFTLLMELKKNEASDKNWTVIAPPKNPIK